MEESVPLPARASKRLPTAVVAAGVCFALGALAFLFVRPRVIEAYPDQLAGIGIVVQNDSGAHVIGRMIDGGPAASAGLHVGDRILAINGEATEGRTLANVVSQLRGKPGSDVILQIAGNGGASVVTVTRQSLARGEGGGYKAQ